MPQAKVMSIEWVIDPKALGKAIETQYARKVVERAKRRVHDAAPEAEGLMKRNAPWTDRTGEARKLLMAEVKETDKDITLYLIHGAAHGVFLELARGGRYAIIAPTLVDVAGRLRQRLGGLV